MLQGLTKELYDVPVGLLAQRQLRDTYLHEATESTYQAAPEFANSTPRPPKRALYDKNLRNTGTLAWYLDPLEVKATYPREGAEIERAIGSEPLMGLNPDLLYVKDKKKHRSIARHEGRHGAQPGKQIIKRLQAITDYGALPVGLMFIEGSVEWSLERWKEKAPSTYMAEESPHRTPTYKIFKDFVYDLEKRQKGIVRQIYRAAQRGGPNAVIRLFNEVPGIEELTNYYAAQLNGNKKMTVH